MAARTTSMAGGAGGGEERSLGMGGRGRESESWFGSSCLNGTATSKVRFRPGSLLRVGEHRRPRARMVKPRNCGRQTNVIEERPSWADASSTILFHASASFVEKPCRALLSAR